MEDILSVPALVLCKLVLVYLLSLVTVYIVARLCCRAWVRTKREYEEELRRRKELAHGPRRD